jgi:two-component system, chemotaxis family, CheB/CheR fusion protein
MVMTDSLPHHKLIETVSLGKLLEMIRKNHGLDLNSDEPSFVKCRIQAAMLDQEVGSYDAYCEWRVREPRGFDHLYQYLFISKTEFFCNPELWTYLRDETLSTLLQKCGKLGRPLRIWCGGCASGEEPYSLAILITDLLGSKSNQPCIEILASDVNQQALNSAHNGVYTQNALTPPLLK